jgi:ParB family chromosome partitioning protein
MKTLTLKNKNAPAAQGRAEKLPGKPAGLLSGMGDLSSLLDAAEGAGGPLQLDMRLIDEDPNQPRTEDNPGFSEESLAELAESIKLRGVKTPISVRDNPDVPGRFIINHGARRFRSSKIAQQPTVPGFVDNDYNEADQVVENLQRNELTSREIADYIGRELAKGIKKGEIAKSISKSAAFVTQHANLLDLPEAIAEAFNSGRVNDVTVVNELVTAHKKKPQEVSDWLADEGQEITRGSVKLLREFLDEKGKKPEAGGEGGDQGGSGDGGEEGNEGAGGKKKEKAGDPEKFKKAIIQVQHNGRPARLLLDRRPPAEGFAWLKYEDDGQEFEANLSLVTLTAVLEG